MDYLPAIAILGPVDRSLPERSWLMVDDPTGDENLVAVARCLDRIFDHGLIAEAVYMDVGLMG